MSLQIRNYGIFRLTIEFNMPVAYKVMNIEVLKNALFHNFLYYLVLLLFRRLFAVLFDTISVSLFGIFGKHSDAIFS